MKNVALMTVCVTLIGLGASGCAPAPKPVTPEETKQRESIHGERIKKEMENNMCEPERHHYAVYMQQRGQHRGAECGLQVVSPIETREYDEGDNDRNVGVEAMVETAARSGRIYAHMGLLFLVNTGPT